MSTTTSTTISSKGQVVIPKALRESCRWTAGTRLELRSTPEGLLLTRSPAANKVPLAEGLAAIRQRLAYRGPAISLAAMDEAVLREARRSAEPLREATPRARAGKPR